MRGLPCLLVEQSPLLENLGLLLVARSDPLSELRNTSRPTGGHVGVDHVGVGRLAACVVELLYFFFGDSLDKLPPDLGLFP